MLYVHESNVCVGCSADSELCRFSVVPHAFRRHMPESYKSRNSHDILLLCKHCLNKIEVPFSTHRNRLFAEHRIDPQAPQKRFDQDPARHAVRSAARALLQREDQLPGYRAQQFRDEVRPFLTVGSACVISAAYCLLPTSCCLAALPITN